MGLLHQHEKLTKQWDYQANKVVLLFGAIIYILYLHLVKAVSLRLSVYIVKRGYGSSVPILVRNLTDNTIIEYSSMSAAAVALGMIDDSQLLPYVAKGKPYSNREGNLYLIEFKTREDRDKGLARYNKRLATMKASRTTKNR
jgi:hypothetical protein